MEHPTNNLTMKQGAAVCICQAILFCVAMGGVRPAGAAEDWDPVRYQDRDYVKAADLAKFYQFTKTESGREVLFSSPTIEMRAVMDSDEITINGIAFLLSYPAVRANGDALISRVDLCKLIDPVLRPAQISEAEDFQTVVIDPGHGGRDSGSRGLADEKVYTLDLSKKLFTQLILRGFKVKFTRIDDEYVSLRERVDRANEIDKAIFVSLHFNSHESSKPHGIETFAITPPGTRSTGNRKPEAESWRGNLRDSESIALATAVHASVLTSTNAADRGVRRARFFVLKGLNMPGILFEGGYISNPEERANVDKDAYRSLMANAIADGIVKFRGALQRKN
ncbi:MAG: N-acetylmuramoyl-L-alanine amidase [Verrucomicrobiales bacterium]